MTNARDGFKWLGEGFEGFPKILPEDCVEYTIYIVESKYNDPERREQLRKIQTAGLKMIKELTKDFIWQREAINLVIEREDGKSFIRGRTNYGDSVEDEWLIVFVLRELSKKFPSTWVRIVDADGQFLLAEAAGVLPRWLNPEIADYRVWLNNGRLLIIGIDTPEQMGKHSKTKSLNLQEALEFINHYPSKMLDSSEIQAEAFYRLQKYPGQIKNSLHHAIASIPRRLAYILHQGPSYISPAVEAFYLRDPIALRPLQAPNSDELKFPPTDCVRTSIKFTKVGFAQLKSQQFDRPRAWGKEITDVTSDSKMRAELDLGMKVASAFEMMLSDPQNQDRKVVREIKLLFEDLEEEGCSLPTNESIRAWGMQSDDEKWLDVNFEEFEKELAGRTPLSANEKGSFGDKSTQDDFRKMMSRFEQFLSNDAAGIDGGEYLDDMDEDEDEGEEEGEDDILSGDNEPTSESQDISFREDEFKTMLRAIIGMPSKAMQPQARPLPDLDALDRERAIGDLADDDDGGEDLTEDIYTIEKELQEAGILQLNSREVSNEPARSPKAIDAGPSEAGRSIRPISSEDPDDEEVDIDSNFAENLLQSLKSQGGAPGPGSNLMGLMGTYMPRDEHEQDP